MHDAFQVGSRVVGPNTHQPTALLLPDGRVLSGGGDFELPSTTMEIYSPPYLYQPNSDNLADRPGILTAPAIVNYSTSFNVTIKTTTLHTIARATFLRPGSVTHGINMEQRFVEPTPPPVQNGANVQVTAPDHSRQAPPGYYLLFLINSLGVPSEARIIQLL